jgi:hypothetical protein
MRKDKKECGVTRPRSGGFYKDRGTCRIKSRVISALDPATSMTLYSGGTRARSRTRPTTAYSPHMTIAAQNFVHLPPGTPRPDHLSILVNHGRITRRLGSVTTTGPSWRSLIATPDRPDLEHRRATFTIHLPSVLTN